MRERFMFLANLSLFAIASMVFATIQTSLWFQIFGYLPAPALWLPPLIYIALFRSTMETVIFSYIAGFVVSTMTAMPEGIIMTVCLAMALSTQILKRRIYWASSSYFMMVCGLGSLVFHVYHWIATFLIGDFPMNSPQIMDWLVEALLTPLAASVIFPILVLFDRITDRESSNEVTAQIS